MRACACTPPALQLAPSLSFDGRLSAEGLPCSPGRVHVYVIPTRRPSNDQLRFLAVLSRSRLASTFICWRLRLGRRTVNGPGNLTRSGKSQPAQAEPQAAGATAADRSALLSSLGRCWRRSSIAPDFALSSCAAPVQGRTGAHPRAPARSPAAPPRRCCPEPPRRRSSCPPACWTPGVLVQIHT